MPDPTLKHGRKLGLGEMDLMKVEIIEVTL